MRAMTIPRFGGPEVLELREMPAPTPSPGEVTIDVAFAGVNFAEVLYRRGLVEVERPFIPGIEVAGTIRALGSAVAGFEVGQPVAALTIVQSGGYAEVVRVAAELVVPLERLGGKVPLAVAAAAPSNVTTAFLVLETVAHLAPSERVLVHAAAGGVGSVLGQAARTLGAGLVVGTVGSVEKIAIARQFGFDHAFLREEMAAELPQLTGGTGLDVVVDQVGGTARTTSLAMLAPLGRLVVMGNASDAPDTLLSANDLWLTNRTVSGFNLAAFSARFPLRAGAALRRALSAVAQGQIRVEVREVLPLDQAAEAHRRIEGRGTTGKLVLQVRETFD